MGRVGQWFPEICFRSFAQDLATPSARSFAHRIPHEIIEASFMREALRHFLLENQMSHASHASHTSHPQAESKARSTLPSPLTFTPQVCGGKKRLSPLQACVKCVFGVFQGGLWVALCRGCVIFGDARLQRNRKFHHGQQMPQRTGDNPPSRLSGAGAFLRPPQPTTTNKKGKNL